MLMTAAGCASTQMHEGTGEYVHTKVNAVILEESYLRFAEINVQTFKSMVQLSGFVSSSVHIKKQLRLPIVSMV